MASKSIEYKGRWVKTVVGSWINSEHVDLFEVNQSKDDQKVWQIRGWNALQPQVEAYVVGEFKSESQAQTALNQLVSDIS